MVDLAATGAREVALEQRLEHQHERIALVALELLLEDVACDAVVLYQPDSHRLSRLLSYRAQPSVPVLASIPSRKWVLMCTHSILNHGATVSGEDVSSLSRHSTP